MTNNDSYDQEDAASNRRREGLSVTVTGRHGGLAEEIRRTARRALRSQNHGRGRLDIAVVGAAEMRRQNIRWMQDDSATDVLSFDLRDEQRAGHVDGQLLVCRSVALRRARRRGTDWRTELLLYIVHGCLHLCGHDDLDEERARRMHELEDRILEGLGWGRVFSGSGLPLEQSDARDKEGHC